jgi:hypothetical protein
MTRGLIGYRPVPFRAHGAASPWPVRFFLIRAPGPEFGAGLPLGPFPMGLLNQYQARAFEGHRGSPEPVRTLSPEAGWRRIVVWGEFKQLLQREIAHPERLRDSHRLACSVAVHEADALLPRGEVERQLQESEAGVRLEPLTRELIARLGLGAVLPESRRVSGAGQPRRFVELHVLEDPTARFIPGALPPPEPDRPSGPNAVPKRTAIPPQWIRPWEFRLSRDEAVYDMHATRTRWGRLRTGAARVLRFAATRAAMQKWKAMLTGKPIDQQLWEVRPPHPALMHAAARRWVAQALAAAGYDPASMLDEWEIFWRRKGV